MIDGFKGLYVEMEDSYNECLLQFVQSVNRTKYGHCYHDDKLEKDSMNETIDTNIDVNIDDSIEQSQLPNNISTSSNKRVAKNQKVQSKSKVSIKNNVAVDSVNR